jgi:hypothetical protein
MWHTNICIPVCPGRTLSISQQPLYTKQSTVTSIEYKFLKEPCKYQASQGLGYSDGEQPLHQ